MRDEPVTDDLRLLWATPLLTRQFAAVDELNAGLERAILELRKVDQGVQLSHFRGWQSTGNLFQHDAPEFSAVRDMMAQAVADCMAEIGGGAVDDVSVDLFAWAIVLDPGGYHNYHNHPHSHFSGSYYVRTEPPRADDPNSGVICFYEPRAAGAMAYSPDLSFGEDFEISPSEGSLIVFPSFLGHSVHPFTGPGKRIAVSFNALVAGR